MDFLEESDDDKPVQSEKTKKITFSKELKSMMYGFGDAKAPYEETIKIMDELVLQYIIKMTLKAVEVLKPGRISVEDIIFLVRKDDKKYSRIRELLTVGEELKRARKVLDTATTDIPPVKSVKKKP